MTNKICKHCGNDKFKMVLNDDKSKQKFICKVCGKELKLEDNKMKINLFLE